jgi:hypothetical protein
MPKGKFASFATTVATGNAANRVYNTPLTREQLKNMLYTIYAKKYGVKVTSDAMYPNLYLY